MTLRKLLLGFNLSLLLMLCLSIALPYALLGKEALYRSTELGYVYAIMLVSFISINIYFSCNWVLFQSMDRGDWQTVSRFLRKKIFHKQIYSKRYIFYFIEVAIQLNNLSLLRELHEELFVAQFSRTGTLLAPNRAQKRLCDFAIELGLVYLIEEPGQNSELYFGELRENPTFCQARYAHKYKWAELFYAIALLVQGKQTYAAKPLEQLLLPSNTPKRNWAMRFLTHENALLQLLCIQLLEDLQGEDIEIDWQLVNLRRMEIQQLYDSPKNWASYLAREQSQNIAIAIIGQLVEAAYEKQLRPTHQAYMPQEKSSQTSAQQN